MAGTTMTRALRAASSAGAVALDTSGRALLGGGTPPSRSVERICTSPPGPWRITVAASRFRSSWPLAADRPTDVAISPTVNANFQRQLIPAIPTSAMFTWFDSEHSTPWIQRDAAALSVSASSAAGRSMSAAACRINRISTSRLPPPLAWPTRSTSPDSTSTSFSTTW